MVSSPQVWIQSLERKVRKRARVILLNIGKHLRER